VRGLLALTAVVSLAYGADLSANSPALKITFHDFKNARAVIRNSFDEAWNGNRSFSYQSYTCVSSNSFTESDGKRDQRPVKIEGVMLLGTKNQSGNSPVYLVSGSRMVWISRNNSTSEYAELPCTWLVAFSGNQIQGVREANELSYLMSGKNHD
jgi:hypothetical protein